MAGTFSTSMGFTVSDIPNCPIITKECGLVNYETNGALALVQESNVLKFDFSSKLEGQPQLDIKTNVDENAGHEIVFRIKCGDGVKTIISDEYKIKLSPQCENADNAKINTSTPA